MLMQCKTMRYRWMPRLRVGLHDVATSSQPPINPINRTLTPIAVSQLGSECDFPVPGHTVRRMGMYSAPATGGRSDLVAAVARFSRLLR